MIYLEKNDNISIVILEGSMADTRLKVILKCSECGNENYNATRNKKLHAEKMEVRKYCPKCKKETLHKEKK